MPYMKYDIIVIYYIFYIASISNRFEPL